MGRRYRILSKISWLAFRASLMSALTIFVVLGISLVILNWLSWERERDWFKESYLEQRKVLLVQMVEQTYNTIEHMSFMYNNKGATQEEILRLLASMQNTFHNERYIIIMDENGDVLVGADGYNQIRPNTKSIFVNNGQSMYDFLHEHVKKNPNGGFVQYSWKNIHDPEETQRLSYIIEVPNYKWIIGAGIRLNDFDAYIEQHRQAKMASFNKEMSQFAILSLVLLSVVIFFSSIMRKKSDESLAQFVNSLKDFATHHKEIDLEEIKFDELRELAKLINSMMNSEIRARKREEELNFELHRYIDIIDKYVITSSTDLNGRIIYASEAFCKISGYTKSEIMRMPHSIVRHPDMQKSTYEEMWAEILKDDFKSWRGEIKNLTKDGEFYWVDTQIEPLVDMYGARIGYIAIRQDITDKKRIEKLSITDEMTGLYNRRHFNTVMSREIQRASRANKALHFAIFDIDHFKQLNDLYGHQKGDEALIKVAEVLKKSLNRAGDFAFRLGGEEFGIVITDAGKGDVFEFVDTIRQAVERLNIPHDQNENIGHVTVSFGLFSCDTGDCYNLNTIYKMADKALYRAKVNGRNRGESDTRTRHESE